ncbi:unnamed protein product [Symbiodinium sp. CCMP2592]|nr:unnamed protein product [Symbiodinium sp. CCMP2592]
MALSPKHATSLLRRCGEESLPIRGERRLRSLRSQRIEIDVLHCNALICGWSRQSHWEEVLGFSCLQDIPGDGVTCSAAVSACARAQVWQRSCYLATKSSADAVALSAALRAGSWERAINLLTHMLHLGLEVDAVSVGAAVTSCQVAAAWVAAMALVQQMSFLVNLNRLVCHAAMIACQRMSAHLAAMALLKSMVGWKVRADCIGFAIVCNACASAEAWVEGSAALAWMQEKLISSDMVACNSVLCSLGLRWRLAALLCQGSAKLMTSPDVVSCNTLMGSCTRGSAWLAAVQAHAAMHVAALQPNAVSQMSLLGAWEQVRRWPKALSSLRASSAAYGAAISSCARCSQATVAQKLLREMAKETVRKNLLCVNAAMSGHDRQGSWEEALSFRMAGSADGLGIDCISLSTIASASERGSAWHAAMEVLSLAAACCVRLDLLCCGLVLNACSRSQLWTLALSACSALASRHLVVDGACTAAALGAWVAGRHWAEALELWHCFKDVGSICGDVDVARNAAVAAMGRLAQWRMSLELLPGGVVKAQDAVGYSAAILAFERSGEFDLVLHFLTGMVPSALTPDPRTVEAAVRAASLQGGQAKVAKLLGALGDEAFLNDETLAALYSATAYYKKGP